MGFIYDVLASGNIKRIDNLFEETSGPTKLSFNIYAQATDIVKQSIVTGLATRLQIFQTDKIRNITNKIETSTIVKPFLFVIFIFSPHTRYEPHVYYVIILVF